MSPQPGTAPGRRQEEPPGGRDHRLCRPPSPRRHTPGGLTPGQWARGPQPRPAARTHQGGGGWASSTATSTWEAPQPQRPPEPTGSSGQLSHSSLCPSTPSLAASFPLESVNVGRTTRFTEGPCGPGLQDAREERGREPGPPVSCPQCPVQVPVGPVTAPSPPGPSPGRLVSAKPPQACRCPPRA